MLASTLEDGFTSKDVNIDANGQVIAKNMSQLALRSANDLMGIAASNYYIGTVILSNNPTIFKAPLTISAVSETVDFGLPAQGIPTVQGLYGIDTVANVSQMFASAKCLGNNRCQLVVLPNVVVNDGNQGNNYDLRLISALGSINATLPGLKTDSTGGNAAAVITPGTGQTVLTNWANGRNASGEAKDASHITPRIEQDWNVTAAGRRIKLMCSDLGCTGRTIKPGEKIDSKTTSFQIEHLK